MKVNVLIFVLLSSPACFAQRSIYLHRVQDTRSTSFAFDDPKDSMLMTIAEGYRNPESAGWIIRPGFSLKPTVPDNNYYVYVDKDLKQAGWVKNGLYTGKVWQPGEEDGWVLSVYHKGVKQGAERIIEYERSRNRYYVASIEWYDNGEHPVTTSYFPSGAVSRYAILNHSDIILSEDGSISCISERSGSEWFVQAIPMKQGKLDGQAIWYKGGNGMGTQWLYITFKDNEIIRWQLCEALESGATPIVAQYSKSEHEHELE